MIVSNLQNSQRVEKLHPLFKQLFDYVKSHDLLHEELGTIRLDGDNLIVNNIYPECIPEGKRLLELHHDYIDVHILLEGKETIGWKALEELKVERQAYDKKSDCALYGDVPTTFINLLPGQFVIVSPEDPHAPAIGKGWIRKLIAKVKV